MNTIIKVVVAPINEEYASLKEEYLLIMISNRNSIMSIGIVIQIYTINALKKVVLRMYIRRKRKQRLKRIHPITFGNIVVNKVLEMK